MDLPFQVLPAWWQRPAVEGAFAVSLLLLFVAGALWWTRRLRAQKQHLEAVVEMRTEQLETANKMLVELSYTDALTGLANRRMFQKRLDELMEQEDAAEAICSLALIDVDHFKEFNDRFGHPAGDEALRTIAESLRACTPPTALMARYGGEEFACLLPGVPLEEAVRIAERMRRVVEQRPILVPKRPEKARATISAGVAAAVVQTEMDTHQLLRNADAALYRAKGAGRNCVRTQLQGQPSSTLVGSGEVV